MVPRAQSRPIPIYAPIIHRASLSVRTLPGTAGYLGAERAAARSLAAPSTRCLACAALLPAGASAPGSAGRGAPAAHAGGDEAGGGAGSRQAAELTRL